jgi:hypothetical protein
MNLAFMTPRGNYRAAVTVNGRAASLEQTLSLSRALELEQEQ